MSELQATKWTGNEAPASAAPRLSRRVLLRRSGGAMVALAALLGGGLAARDDGETVPWGVRVAGVPLGGLTTATALARLDDRARQYLARPLDVRAVGAGANGPRWQVLPTALALQLDTAAAVDAVRAVGQAGGRLAGFFPWVEHDLLLPVALDDTRLLTVLQGWVGEVTVQPVNARFRPEQSGQLTIVPDQAGRGIDVAGTKAALLAHAATLGAGPVALALAPAPAPITAAMLQTIAGQAAALVREPLVLRHGDRRWSVDGTQLATALDYQQDGDRLVVVLDPAPLRPLFQQIAGEVARPGADARLALGRDGRYTIVPGEPGAQLDEAATLAAMNATLTDGRHEAALALTPLRQAIAADDLAPVYARLDAILNTPLVVTFEQYSRTFGRGDIFPLLTLTAQPDRQEKVAIGIDRAKLRALTETVAANLNQDVRDAQFKWVDGAVRDVVASQDGRAVQFAPTDDALAAAILGATGQATPVVIVTKPGVSSSAKEQIVIADRLGYGRTDYSFSTPNRKWNVELAMQRLDGVLIPPGAVFSFNAAVGAQTVANGYREAYGIALVGGSGPGTGQVKTVSSVAGGICQISTTLFQASYQAGLPVEERNWHLYWIPSYGPPSSPTGLQGLDATVDDQSGLDFRFTNTTGGWLAIEAVADGASVRIAIYGVNPGWTVRIDDPVITNKRPADPTPQIERTHDLPPGQEVVVEHAVDGFDAANHITVTARDGTTLRDVTFRSSYVPSRNVTQVGVPADQPLN